MHELFREFFIWSIGFAGVSVAALLVGHFIARRARAKRTTQALADQNSDGQEQQPIKKRQPAWGTALVVVFAYLFLLGPVLQGVSRTFRRTNGNSATSPQPAQSSVIPFVGIGAQPRQTPAAIDDSSDCPCQSPQPTVPVKPTKTTEAADIEPVAEIDVQKNRATIELGGLIKSD